MQTRCCNFDTLNRRKNRNSRRNYRLTQQHACTKLIGHLANVPNNIRHTGQTVVPQCMPDEYKVAGDTIAAYKNFYCGSKSRFAKWTKRDVPNWYKEDKTCYRRNGVVNYSSVS